MKRWPLDQDQDKDIQNVERLYQLNEEGSEGFYPVGANNGWHSGVHLPAKESDAIYPLLGGELVAYRIATEYYEKDFPEKISEDEYKELSNENKKYYEENIIRGDLKIYTIKESDECPKEKYATGFFLLRHMIKLPYLKDPTVFFTLYTNLEPIKYSFYWDFRDDYKDLSDFPNKSYPFFLTWNFKLKESPENRAFVYKGFDNIYPRSRFKIEFGVNNWSKYLKELANIFYPANFDDHVIESIGVKFINREGSAYSDIPPDDISFETESPCIKTKEEPIVLYRNTTNNGFIGINKIKKHTELSIDLSLKYLSDIDQHTQYLPVKVKKEHIFYDENDNNYPLKGWLLVNDAIQYKHFNKDDDNDVPELDLLQVTEGEQPFFYNIEQLDNVSDDQNVTFNMKRLFRCNSGEYFKYLEPDGHDRDGVIHDDLGHTKELYHKTMDNQQYYYVEFYIQYTSYDTFYVKIEDFDFLVLYGHLKEPEYVKSFRNNGEIPSSELLKKYDIKQNSLQIYNFTFDKTEDIASWKGNACGLLCKDQEFDLIRSEDILSENKAGFYGIKIKDDNESDSPIYIYLRDKSQLQGYCEFDLSTNQLVVINPDQNSENACFDNLNINLLLGHAGTNYQGDKRFIEYALFFKNLDFFDPGNMEYPCFIIPEGEVLYNAEKEAEAHKYFFPTGTEFTILDNISASNSRAKKSYLVELKAIRLFIANSYLTNIYIDKYAVIMNAGFSKYHLGNWIIDYQSNDSWDKKIEPFVNAFYDVYEKFKDKQVLVEDIIENENLVGFQVDFSSLEMQEFWNKWTDFWLIQDDIENCSFINMSDKTIKILSETGEVFSCYRQIPSEIESGAARINMVSALEFKHYFPENTNFSIIGISNVSDKYYYKVRLKSLYIFISKENFYGIEKGKYCHISDDIPNIFYVNYSKIEYTDGGNNVSCDDSVRQFATHFKHVYPKLAGKKVLIEESGDDPTAYSGIRIEFSDELKMYWRFWINHNDIFTMCEIIENQKIINWNNDQQQISCYNSNPLYAYFSEKSPQDYHPDDSLYIKNPSDELIDPSSKEHYYEFTDNITNQRFFIPKTHAESELKNNLYKWNDYFHTIEGDTNDDLICDLEADIIDKIEDISVDKPQYINSILSKEEIQGLFNNRSESENKELIREIRRTLYKHPLEWNKDLYEDIGNKLTNYFGVGKSSDGEESTVKDIVEAQDIWSGIKNRVNEIKNQGVITVNDLENLTDINLWFAHPFKFIDHLDKAGFLEINPYFPEAETNYGPTIKVFDNPGFAPITDKKLKSFIEIMNERIYYAKITGAFNDDYSVYYSNLTYFYHEGLDLQGIEGTSIHSLIYGKVIAKGWKKYYGRTLLIKDLQKPILYLLAHLSDYNAEIGDNISPRDIVAFVGGSATNGAGDHFENRWKPHLHITVYKCNQGNSEIDIQQDVDEYIWSPNAQQVIVNPFNHSETWKGKGTLVENQ